jgi:hypothetical protein
MSSPVAIARLYPEVDLLPFSGIGQCLEFRLDDNSTGRMSTATYQELHRRNCIQVEGLRPMDLQNPIHEIFRRERFMCIADDEYNRLEPALKLVSRFITEPEYLKFFTHINTSTLVDDTRPGVQRTAKNYTIQVLEADPAVALDDPVAVADTQKALLALANDLTFVILDEDYSKADWARAAETFINPDHRRCRRNETMAGGCATGTCAFHDNHDIARCNVCNATYYKEKTFHELRRILADRPTAHGFPGVKLKADLIDVLEDLDADEEDEDYVAPSDFGASAAQASNIQTGLHWDLLKHIRDSREDEFWTESEELRFQLAVVGTLCHEIVHAFWWHSRRRCWNCEEHDPWWSVTERRHGDLPELGISWEQFAFGSRLPGAGKLLDDDDRDTPNIFQRCQWGWVDNTLQGGVCMNRLLKHHFIVPVDYVHAWFQESTWRDIATYGRETGRPSQQNHQIMRLEPQDMAEEAA